MAERHLVLGGGGFIGRHVARLLLEAGHHVVLANRRGATCSFPSYLAGTVTWRVFDFATADWTRLLAGIDVVHHYAWSSIPATANADPAGDLSRNVAGTLRMLDAAILQQAPPRIVFASSGGTVYGPLRDVPAKETHPLAPITAYGAAKVAVEMYLGFYRAMHGLDCRIARLANPFGAGQDPGRGQGAASLFVQQALDHRQIQIWGSGAVVRDYIHVSDVAGALVRLADAPKRDDIWVFNLAGGRGISLNQIVAELETRLGRAVDVARTPGRAFDVPVSVLDISLARDELGWSPRLSFEEGIARTIRDVRRPADQALAVA